jgi:hypothetical protein
LDMKKRIVFLLQKPPNERGGTDSRVLAQVLHRHVTTMFPDSADQPGKKVLLKIDGGPGRLLFTGVQNAMHITQETDQNYDQFKSLLRKHIQLLINKQYAEYKRCQQENFSCDSPNLNRSHYGILLGGKPADDEKGLKEIPPMFELSFSKEKNLWPWEMCGGCPLTIAPLNHPSLRVEVDVDKPYNQLQEMMRLLCYLSTIRRSSLTGHLKCFQN